MTPADLKEWRQAMGGLTQLKAAQLLGVRRQTIIEWEGGQRPTPPMLAHALAALYRNAKPWPHTQRRKPKQ